jgi:CheY-like chemotaxis protein
LARILCVDDEPAALSLKKEILEQAGYSVMTAMSVKEAIRQLELAGYDAIVTDWRFEEGEGRAIVEAAKSRFSIPVVVVSGYVGEAFQAAEPLADIYIEKPADSRELLQILKILLEVRTSKDH